MEDINERIMDEGYAINPEITSDEGYRIIPESSSDNKKKEDLKDERVYDLNNGSDNLLGFISNEIYYPIKKDKKILKKDISIKAKAKTAAKEASIANSQLSHKIGPI